MQPFGNHVAIHVGAVPPKHDIGQGIVTDVGTWIKGSYDLYAGDEVQFRILDMGHTPKANDDIFVRIEDIFAIVVAVERPPLPEPPVPLMAAPPDLPPPAQAPSSTKV